MNVLSPGDANKRPRRDAALAIGFGVLLALPFGVLGCHAAEPDDGSSSAAASSDADLDAQLAQEHLEDGSAAADEMLARANDASLDEATYRLAGLAPPTAHRLLVARGSHADKPFRSLHDLARRVAPWGVTDFRVLRDGFDGFPDFASPARCPAAPVDLAAIRGLSGADGRARVGGQAKVETVARTTKPIGIGGWHAAWSDEFKFPFEIEITTSGLAANPILHVNFSTFPAWDVSPDTGAMSFVPNSDGAFPEPSRAVHCQVASATGIVTCDGLTRVSGGKLQRVPRAYMGAFNTARRCVRIAEVHVASQTSAATEESMTGLVWTRLPFDVGP